MLFCAVNYFDLESLKKQQMSELWYTEIFQNQKEFELQKNLEISMIVKAHHVLRLEVNETHLNTIQ